MLRLIRFAVIALLIITAGACSEPSAPEPVATVTLTVNGEPHEAIIFYYGGEVQFSATALDAAGKPLQGRAVAWNSTNPASVTIGPTGLAKAVGRGVAVVSATIENVRASMNVTVPLPLTSADFILIQPGKFKAVTITKPFYLQRTEVTQAQWRQVKGNWPSYFTNCVDCPVEQVTFDDVQDFIFRLNAANPGVTYRLPTEAEWEYAARAGSTGLYGGTGVVNDMAWYDGNSGGRTRVVATKQPNTWGLYDMHGNVEELVQDYFRWEGEGYDPWVPSTDPLGPTSGTHRVKRGGAWWSPADACSADWRASHHPQTPSRGVGFRLARTP